ncbi:hypothetical protein CASFOL_033788 [Castilleja foliolosa]|uniref:Uncharacterized protein n=1 Tax=Castilleja foliolosa TaxID=1961234 RepID=A0ABD3BYJ3_9LAMI
MSCLLPQFKCSLDTFAVNFKSQNHSFVHTSRNRDAINFRTQYILAVTSARTSTASTTVLEFEDLQLSPLKAIPNSVPADRSWTISTSTAKSSMLDLEKLTSLDTRPITIAGNKPLTYIGSVGAPSEVNLGTSFDRETLLTSEEAVINAAASEALALAKAALRVAKDVAMIPSQRKSTKPDSTELDTTMVEKSAESVVCRESKVVEIGSGANYPASEIHAESDDVEPSPEELEFLEAQLSMSIAVRSNRQTERKARRTKAAEKAAANIVSVKSSSSNRKKRSSVQEVDYNDPLRYIRGTTSTSRLLTASEEQMLSEGIQVNLFTVPREPQGSGGSNRRRDRRSGNRNRRRSGSVPVPDF